MTSSLHTERLYRERVASWSWQGHAYIPQAKALHIVPLWCIGWCMTFTGLGETWPPFFLFGWTVISSSKLNTTLTLQVLISFKNRASWALPFQVKFVSKLSSQPSCMGNACMCKPKERCITAGNYTWTWKYIWYYSSGVALYIFPIVGVCIYTWRSHLNF